MKLKAYRLRLRPTPQQQRLLRRYFGTSRWTWNKCLAWRSDAYKSLGESVTGVDFSRELTFLKTLPPFTWLRETLSTVVTQTLRDQDAAFKKFFKEGSGYPRFKSRHDQQSIRFQLDQRIVAGNFKAGDLLKLPGLGALKVVWSRTPPAGCAPKMVTITLDQAQRYWVSFAVEESIQARTTAAIGRSIGLDLGVSTLITTSHGVKIENPRHLQRYRHRMTRLQQRLSRQQKGSNRRKKTQFQMARLHAKIADCRREHLHRVTTRLINDNQVIVVEDLNAKGMSASAKGDREKPGKRVRQKAGLNRAILDVSFGELVRQLTYKADWYGRTLIKVGRFFPSSKSCSVCGHRLDELRLDQRTWTCPECGTEHDRDINAAKNIEQEGLRILYHPEDTGDVRASGGEGVYPMAVSARSLNPVAVGMEPAC